MPFPTNPTPGQTHTEDNTTWVYAGPVNGWYRRSVSPGNSSTFTVGGSASATGAAGEIQYTDGTNLAASPNLVWDDVNDELEVGGDVVLDDGGTFTTTLQTITPTANRTVSLPDATGTVALVAGSSGQLVYNNAGAQAGAPGSVVGATGDITLGLNGAASTPPLDITGTWFTGGTSTTTKPQVLIEPAGTTSTAWSTSGTGLGVNAASTFAGNLLDLQVNGTSLFRSSAAGGATVFGSSTVNSAIFTIESRGNDNQFLRFAALSGQVSSLAGISGRLRITVNDSAGGTPRELVNVLPGSAGVGRSILLNQELKIGWRSEASDSWSSLGTADLEIQRDAAGTLAQRNGTNAQTFRVYGTFTDASNYVRASLSSTSTAVTLAAETAGTGADNIPLNLTAAGTGTVKVNSVAEVVVSSTVAGLPAAPVVGMLTRVTDATAPAVGSTVAGGGAAAALVWYNGANWSVIGV